MLARVCPMAVVVEVALLLVAAVASFLRQRRVQGHLVERHREPLLGPQEEDLAWALRLKLALHCPAQVWVVVQSCLEPLLCSKQPVVEYQALFQYGTRQAPKYAHLS